uniref:Pco079304 n=1 Tax=Arundo donax TaxID=35708 RepID=A0A0A9EC19_ARUDO
MSLYIFTATSLLTSWNLLPEIVLPSSSRTR